MPFVTATKHKNSSMSFRKQSGSRSAGKQSPHGTAHSLCSTAPMEHNMGRTHLQIAYRVNGRSREAAAGVQLKQDQSRNSMTLPRRHRRGAIFRLLKPEDEPIEGLVEVETMEEPIERGFLPLEYCYTDIGNNQRLMWEPPARFKEHQWYFHIDNLLIYANVGTWDGASDTTKAALVSQLGNKSWIFDPDAIASYDNATLTNQRATGTPGQPVTCKAAAFLPPGVTEDPEPVPHLPASEL